MQSSAHHATHATQEDMATTLIVKHAPPSIAGTPEQAIAYFGQYHPTDVRPMETAAMKGTVFLDFANPSAAAQAYNRLQQLHQYGDVYKKIQVEYAKPDPTRGSRIAHGHQQQQSQPSSTDSKAAPIAPHLGIDYPANPHLRYRYPDPTPEILDNIMHAIATVPRLYVQTLHLMNKMSLPPPFGPVQSDSIPTRIQASDASRDASLPAGDKRKHDALVASDESELESDEDEKRQEKDKQAAKSRVLAAASQRKRLFLRNQKR